MKYVVNTRNFIILFLAATFNYIGSFMTESLLSVYSKQLGATDVLVGMVPFGARQDRAAGRHVLPPERQGLSRPARAQALGAVVLGASAAGRVSA